VADAHEGNRLRSRGEVPADKLEAPSVAEEYGTVRGRGNCSTGVLRLFAAAARFERAFNCAGETIVRE
jgi:hypothetical protein